MVCFGCSSPRFWSHLCFIEPEKHSGSAWWLWVRFQICWVTILPKTFLNEFWLHYFLKKKETFLWQFTGWHLYALLSYGKKVVNLARSYWHLLRWNRLHKPDCRRTCDRGWGNWKMTDGWMMNGWTSGAPGQLDSVVAPLHWMFVATGSAKCGRRGSLEIQITDVELLESDLYRRIPYEHSSWAGLHQ